MSNLQPFSIPSEVYDKPASELTKQEAAAMLLERRMARRSFWGFFRYMDPDALRGWWQEDAAEHLQQFYDDLIDGKRPKLVIQAPPQNGKSRLIVDYVAWLLGKLPDRPVIYASFSESLGVRANLRLQRMLDSQRYKALFPDTRLNDGNVVTQSAKPRRNSAHLELVGQNGGFRNTTIRGSITGESLGLGIIDDPLKGREEAESRTVRDKTWDWLNDDFFTRFSDDAGMLVILTRWHLDDPVGRLLDERDDIKVLTYKAIAEKDEPHRKAGEALFPEFKSLEFLLDKKRTMRPESWASLYQQNPVPRDGAIVKNEWLATRYRERGEAPEMIVQSWDCASKPKERNDPSGCGTFAVFADRVELWDVEVKRREFPDLVRACKDKYAAFPGVSAVLIEDKDAGQQLIQQLRRDTSMPVIAINPGTLDKVTRMDTETPFLSAGKLWLPEQAQWVADYVEELVTFPSAAHDERVDLTSQFLKWMRERPVQRRVYAAFSV